MLKANPKSRLALRCLAQELARDPRKMHEAVGFYERYVKLAKTDIKARAALMFMLLRLGRAAEAVKHAGKLWELSPEVPRRLLEYAGLLEQLGRKSDAIAALKKGVAHYRSKKRGDALHLLALSLARLGAHGQAKTAFEAMLAMDGKSRRYHRLYGRYLWRRAQRKEALKVWGATLGAKKAKALAYARWAELLEGVQAWRYPALRPLLRKQISAGLRRFPRDPTLLQLRRRLGGLP